MQNYPLDDLGKATKRQIGKHVGLLDRIPSITNLAREVTNTKGKRGTTITSRIASAFGLENAPVLTFILGIVFIMIVGWILKGCIGASTTSRPTYILFIQQCFTIWLWILIILIVVNFLLNMIIL